MFTATVRPFFVRCCSLFVSRCKDFLPFPTSMCRFRSSPLYTFPNAPSPTILCKEMSSNRISHGSKSSELDLKNIRILESRAQAYLNRPNDSNTSAQHSSQLLAQHLQAPAKRSQHFSETYRNIVGRSILHKPQLL